MPPPPYRSVRLDDVVPIPALDAELLWRPLRATLGFRASGINAYTARAAGDRDLDALRDREGFPA